MSSDKAKALNDLLQSMPEVSSLNDLKVWAFSGPAENIQPLHGSLLQTSMHRIMQRSFEALCQLNTATDRQPHADNSNETFLNRIFGEYSIPKELATTRKGLLTPVRFTDKPHYLYWNYVKTDTGIVSGIILIIPSSLAENAQAGLQNAANVMTASSNNQFDSLPSNFHQNFQP